VNYHIDDWGTAFNANVTVTNGSSAALNGWSLVFSFPGAQKITNIWNAVATQSGKQVTATNAAYNGSVPAGGTVSFGFSASSTAGTNAVPASFTLNGKACAVS
jgi:cellulase/cellobiase CelA1